MMISIIKMTPKEWDKIEDHPRQRDTERHANKMRPLLQVAIPEHHVVSAARLPGGQLLKLDGHSRSWLWSRFEIPVPDSVSVIVYPATSLEDVDRQYSLGFDSSSSTKNSADTVFGLFREAGIQPESNILKKGLLSNVLRMLELARHGQLPQSKDAQTLDVVMHWRENFLSLDRLLIGRSSTWTHSGILAAMMLTIRKHGFEAVEPFWTSYLTVENGMTTDPSIKLRLIIERLKAQRQTGGIQNVRDIAEKALACVEHALIGNEVIKIYGTDITHYLRSIPSKSVGVALRDLRNRENRVI
jgi:hypothetical protein